MKWTPSSTLTSDVDECVSTSCHVNASCINTPGSFSCLCDLGHTGNGYSCTGRMDANITSRCTPNMLAESLNRVLQQLIWWWYWWWYRWVSIWVGFQSMQCPLTMSTLESSYIDVKWSNLSLDGKATQKRCNLIFRKSVAYLTNFFKVNLSKRNYINKSTNIWWTGGAKSVNYTRKNLRIGRILH